MTENEFRDLLYHLNGKLQVNKIGTSGNIWVAMGDLVNKSTKEDLVATLAKFPVFADVIGEGKIVWLKVKVAPTDFKKKSQLDIPKLNIGLFFVTLLTTLMAGTLMEGCNPMSFSELKLGLRFSATLLLILGCHEFAHYFYGRKHNVEVTLPYFIPAPTFIGTLGAVIRIKSPIPHRKALLEIGASGPIAGFIAVSYTHLTLPTRCSV